MKMEKKSQGHRIVTGARGTARPDDLIIELRGGKSPTGNAIRGDQSSQVARRIYI